MNCEQILNQFDMEGDLIISAFKTEIVTAVRKHIRSCVKCWNEITARKVNAYMEAEHPGITASEPSGRGLQYCILDERNKVVPTDNIRASLWMAANPDRQVLAQEDVMTVDGRTAYVSTVFCGVWSRNIGGPFETYVAIDGE